MLLQPARHSEMIPAISTNTSVFASFFTACISSPPFDAHDFRETARPPSSLMENRGRVKKSRLVHLGIPEGAACKRPYFRTQERCLRQVWSASVERWRKSRRPETSLDTVEAVQYKSSVSSSCNWDVRKTRDRSKSEIHDWP